LSGEAGKIIAGAGFVRDALDRLTDGRFLGCVIDGQENLRDEIFRRICKLL